MGKKPLDLLGKTFGNWTVISASDKKTNGGNKYWLCRCTCGNEKEVIGSNLKSGWSKRCAHCVAIARRKGRKLSDKQKEYIRTRMLSNGKCSTNSTTGLKGISKWNSGVYKGYVASIGYEGKKYYLRASHNPDKLVPIREEAVKHALDGTFYAWYANFKGQKKGAVGSK